MGKKILLADDSITIQKVIELTFSDEDFDVVTVGNGRLALEKLAEVRPDIVLCDIIMPEKDGYEVCEHVKTSAASATYPCFSSPGLSSLSTRSARSEVGSDGFLAKPFEPETLIAKVKDLLSRACALATRGAPAGVAEPGGTAPQLSCRRMLRPGGVGPESTPPPLEEVPPAVAPRVMGRRRPWERASFPRSRSKPSTPGMSARGAPASRGAARRG